MKCEAFKWDRYWCRVSVAGWEEACFDASICRDKQPRETAADPLFFTQTLFLLEALTACMCMFFDCQRRLSWNWENLRVRHKWNVQLQITCVPLLLFFFLSGGEASGAGQAGFPQHTQEADCLSAGPAGRGRGEEVCQVTLGEQQPRLRGGISPETLW